ncbi:hypothetical protein KY290_005499 [Solanum tuberosum]|uniref:Uncharacterized protein n=1 Tax=Solanum tuberosum TaxID=4113 RepID=A0ABQ7WGS5_SOLTU|nr:hypothetical protein KY290_005499 [Solanum tuberosum]
MKPLSHMALESTSLNASVSPQHNACPKGFNTNYNSYRGGASKGAGKGAYSSNTNTFRENSSTGNRSNLFVNTANELGIPKTGATSSMFIQPTQEPQEEEVQDLQQMCILLRMIEVSVGNGTDCSGNISSGAANLACILACYSSINEIGPFSGEPSGT